MLQVQANIKVPLHRSGWARAKEVADGRFDQGHLTAACLTMHLYSSSSWGRPWLCHEAVRHQYLPSLPSTPVRTQWDLWPRFWPHSAVLFRLFASDELAHSNGTPRDARRIDSLDGLKAVVRQCSCTCAVAVSDRPARHGRPAFRA